MSSAILSGAHPTSVTCASSATLHTTLRMWLCMKWHGTWLYGVHTERAEMAAVSCGTSRASAVSTAVTCASSATLHTTLRMWLCMKWHGTWLYGVHTERAEMAAVSCGTSHASAVSTAVTCASSATLHTTLRMWLCMKWHGTWLYGVHTERAEMAAVSCGTSHASAVSTQFGGYSKTRYKKLFTHVESHASAVSLRESGE